MKTIFLILINIFVFVFILTIVYLINRTGVSCKSSEFRLPNGGCGTCKTCDGYETLSPCTLDTDAVCSECSNTQYKQDGQCIECLQCNPETECVGEVCTSDKNTVCYSKNETCRLCPETQWSPSIDPTDCVDCTVCTDKQITVSPCTLISDAICKDDPDKYIYVDAILRVGRVRGDDDQWGPVIESSIDFGNNWVRNDQGTNISIRSAVWWDEKKIWVALGDGNIYTSLNGINWSTSRTNTWTPSGVVSCTRDKCVVLFDSYKAVHSTDGETWEEVNHPFYRPTSISTDGSLWVVTGDRPSKEEDQLAHPPTTLAWSENGIDWNGGNDIFPEGIACVKYNGDIWVSAGGGGKGTNRWGFPQTIFKLVYSVDGKDWTAAVDNFELLWDDLVLTPSMVWSGQQWYLYNFGGGIYSSTNGMTWTQILDVGSQWKKQFGYIPKNIHWSGSHLINIESPLLVENVDGDNYWSTSADGITWTTVKVDDGVEYSDIFKGKIPAIQPEPYMIRRYR